MLRLDVGSVALASALLVLACSDPVTNPQGDQAGQSVLADRSGKDNPGRSDDEGDGDGEEEENRIELYDDCNPNDPQWAPTGGCTLTGGKVTLEEFNLLLTSPLSQSVVGHPAWRFEPSYLIVAPGETVELENEGGRLHTFTKVARFGGGRVPPLNQGLTMAPECALAPGAVDPNEVAPAEEKDIGPLAMGNHRYMCCIHPWMRALIKVTPGGSSTSNHEGHSGDGGR
jgi:plastocyanin